MMKSLPILATETSPLWRIAAIGCVVLAVLAAAACQHTTAPVSAAVQFKMHAPFCGGAAVAFRISIDNAVVATDTLMSGHVSGSVFTTPGAHDITTILTSIGSAQLTSTPSHTQDTVVAIGAGVVFVDSVEAYCS